MTLEGGGLAGRTLGSEAASPSKRDLVVMGASAGGLPALLTIVGGLPGDFSGIVLVALHLPAGARSALASILTRAGRLPASTVTEGQILEPGHVYVGPPNRNHVIVGQGQTHLVFGPRENGVRPAVDPLFRSAARAYGARVVGVILSGTGADGTKGLQAVKAAGGVTVVQDPAEAEFAGMPEYAISHVDVDYVLPAVEIAPLLMQMAQGVTTPDDPPSDGCPPIDREEAEHNLALPTFPITRGQARASPVRTVAVPSGRNMSKVSVGSSAGLVIDGAASGVWPSSKDKSWKPPSGRWSMHSWSAPSYSKSR
jgi:two-component system chemotaxis response regulator CheB